MADWLLLALGELVIVAVAVIVRVAVAVQLLVGVGDPATTSTRAATPVAMME